MEAIETSQPLVDLLMKHQEIQGRFRREDVERTIDPKNHVGMSQELTHKAIAYVKERLLDTGPCAEGERYCPLSKGNGACSV